ncbi:amidase [Deinococcus grandis]|uniref:Amidase n=1 Tax=Deinococcus grandis TaxID=57498 RepID=A0A100HIC6_9DEIO|nr:amidase [Deinococcus grandis]BBN95194.1 amidase [Deinococcus grandis]GAQ21313.1 amidase [Deinococcus grandis]
MTDATSALPDPQRAWAFRPASPLPGAPDGPLGGLTFSVKDLFGVAGWPLRASTRAPVPDPGVSPLVTRLLALGASAVGKTHLHEIALGITGVNGFGGTEHPTLPGRVPGGSSSGAAVSVALEQVDFALGTDTGGSIRVPAAWCGVVGFKPTKGHPAWPTGGVLPLSVTCDHAGPLARDVVTVTRVHEALTGQAVPEVALGGLRVGLWLPEGWVTADVRAALLDVADTLTCEGATVQPVDFPEVLDAYSPIVLSEAAHVHRDALRHDDPGFLPFTLASLRQGAALTTAEVQAAHDRRAAYRTQLDDLLTRFDLILAPAVPTPPPAQGQDEVLLPDGPTPLRRAVLRLTAPFSLLGAPVVALPTLTAFVGSQLIAPHGQDDRLLGLARALDRTLYRE